jgi:hypothetical protein
VFSDTGQRGLSHELSEFEAESVSFLVCSRLGIDTTSAEYLSGYMQQHKEVPEELSLELIIKCTGLIEQMERERLKRRSN